MKTPEEIWEKLVHLQVMAGDKKYIKILTDWGKELCEEQKELCGSNLIHIKKMSSFREPHLHLSDAKYDILNAPLPKILQS